MLPLEKQVCSLESAKRLKELGVKQESLFYWSKPFDVNNEFTGDDLEIEDSRWLEYNEMESAKVYSAYTASELGVLLPKKIGSERLRLMRAENGRWVCTYGFLPISPIEFNNESEARAKMLIYLLENKLTTLETVNGN